MARHRLRTAVGLVLVSSTVAGAQPLQFLECSEVNLLGPACDEAVVDQESSHLPPAPEPPLFTLQTMHPNTPPLLLKVFNDPTPANIAAYKAWERRYHRRMFEVEQLLKAYEAQEPKR
jgi:hypothetical protein